MHLTPLWSKSPDGQYRITDATILLVLLAATIVVVLARGPEIVRVPLAIVSALVIPGYAITAALFPQNARTGDDYTVTDPFGSSEEGITPLVRFILSIGLSLAIVPLMALGMDTAGIVLTTGSLLAGVAIITVVGIITAAVRRSSLPESIRYAPTVTIPNRQTIRTYRPGVLTIVLVISLLGAGGAVAYTQTVDTGAPTTTELYFVSADGGLTTDLTVGEEHSVPVAIDASADAATTYTLVGQLQAAERSDSGVTVTGQQEISRQRFTIEPGTAEQLDVAVTPATAGTHRLVILLYEGDAPADPQIETAYREIHLWVTVTE